ncbi:MAG: UvrD-helicase domain-containing protein [Cyanobacteria bacterium P01_D01_bin.1]
MGLTEDQQRAALATGSVAVTAGAGTGKTHMLTERYLHFLKPKDDAAVVYTPLQIVAMTFTDKAATELRSRIRQAVTTQMGDHIDVLANLEAAQISTFHSLAARICREHPDKANVPPDFVVQDGLEGSLWRAEHFTQALAQLPERLYEWVPFSLMRDILAALLNDPLTAEEALFHSPAHWQPHLANFRQSLLEVVPEKPDWKAACLALNFHIGPEGDKRELARQQALSCAEVFASTGDGAYLEELCAIGLRGGSKKNWPDPEDFDAVKDAINTLKEISKALNKALAALVYNGYDDQTEQMRPAIQEAFTLVRSFLADLKYQQRILDYTDLEVQALKALQDPDVQQHYARRWKVFLIDEFQDTNPVQGELLKRLTQGATLTIVGDRKQSIYGFRRADTTVFERWQADIHPGADGPVELSKSFRTHHSLMEQLNQVFEPVLGEMHQRLDANRTETLAPTPEIQLYTVEVSDEQKKDETIDTRINARRLVEAQKIADLVAALLDEPIQVHDKKTDALRSIEPKDIAILARTWGPLELYGNAIASRGIPILQAGGGSLLDTREAKDALALLRFLADASDSLALIAVLRSPFFAVSDRTLYALAQTLPEKTSWWKHLQSEAATELAREVKILKHLMRERRVEAPTRLLQLCDRLTGYTAVIANLPDGHRRMADWNGFVELVRSLEYGSFDTLSVVRRLKQVTSAEVTIPRPAIEGGNAVSLMTIHASKGLEWPVVFVPDLSHKNVVDTSVIRFEASLGLGLKLTDEEGDYQKSALYSLLEQQANLKDEAERKRIYYVAFTRARDRLMLTSAEPAGGGLNLLAAGLTQTITPRSVLFDPTLAQPVTPTPATASSISEQQLLGTIGLDITELPVTALTDYALCPSRFRYRYVEGHLGYQVSDGTASVVTDAMAIGTLTHTALELGVSNVETLAKYAPYLSVQDVQTAFDLAQSFQTDSVYQLYRTGSINWEQSVSLTVGGLTLNGKIDLVGDDFVLDFKTDQSIQPEHHQFQLWAYSKAARKSSAHLAYLRHGHLHSFEAADLAQIETQAEALIERLTKGDFAATASEQSCRICPFSKCCDDYIESSGVKV